MRLLIRCEASPSIGVGHFMRCLALAERADAAMFAMHEGAQLAGERSMPVERLDSDTADVAPVATRWRPDWIVVDLMRADEHLISTLSRIAPVLRLDDGGVRHATASTLILNPNVGITPEDYPPVPVSRLLLGPRYALLRKAFAAQPGRQRDDASVFVGFGGSDAPNLTLRVMSLLAPLRRFRLEVVVGPQNPHRAAVASAAGGYGNVTIHADPPDLSAIMARCDVALTAASGMLWELMAVGTPILAFAIADNQRRNLGWLAENVPGQALGWHADVTDEEIADATCRAISDVEWRNAAAQKGLDLVDGRGAARVLEKMTSLMPVGQMT